MAAFDEIDGDISRRIPHRPPFLWVDRIIRLGADSIETEKEIPRDLDIFDGHYPGRPMMPGVLLCEAVFQSGALLLSGLLEGEESRTERVPILTRILGARFKRQVLPGDRIEITVKLKEKVGPAWFMKGRVEVNGRVAVQVEFACAMGSK